MHHKDESQQHEICQPPKEGNIFVDEDDALPFDTMPKPTSEPTPGPMLETNDTPSTTNPAAHDNTDEATDDENTILFSGEEEDDGFPNEPMSKPTPESPELTATTNNATTTGAGEPALRDCFVCSQEIRSQDILLIKECCSTQWCAGCFVENIRWLEGMVRRNGRRYGWWTKFLHMAVSTSAWLAKVFSKR